MCLILFAYRHHPGYSLIVAANRDEFYDRPTGEARFWEEYPELLAGRDMKYGGTWMGITVSGRFAAITNYRDRTEFREHPLSRGLMVKEFLAGNDRPAPFAAGVMPVKEDYNGFNLLIGDTDTLVYCSNRQSEETRVLKPGVYGLSNHLLDTPWPKLSYSRERLRDHLDNTGPVDPETLFGILSDRGKAPDDQLPDTGFGLDWERILSSPFIATDTYGTRTSTVLLLDDRGRVRFEERSFKRGGVPAGTVHHEFQITQA